MKDIKREFSEIERRWKGQQRPAANYCSAQSRHRKPNPSPLIEEETPPMLKQTDDFGKSKYMDTGIDGAGNQSD
jgi:hypothetical protein